jgi:hypothetical protein
MFVKASAGSFQSSMSRLKRFLIKCAVPRCDCFSLGEAAACGETVWGQVLHGRAPTTQAVGAALQRSKASLKGPAAQPELNHKSVAKWRK